jgi:VanZ family protein
LVVSARRLGLPLGWTVVIFWFSGEDWSADATRDYALLLHRLLPWAGSELLALAHWVARKAGHIAAYGILGGLWLFALGRWRSAVLLAALTGFLDEARQALTPSRGASAADLLLDSASAGLAVALLAGGFTATVETLTGLLLWVAAVVGGLLLLLHLATGAPVGWLGLSTAAAWLLLGWRARRRPAHAP